jgi:hypothetical protein
MLKTNLHLEQAHGATSGLPLLLLLHACEDVWKNVVQCWVAQSHQGVSTLGCSILNSL